MQDETPDIDGEDPAAEPPPPAPAEPEQPVEAAPEDAPAAEPPPPPQPPKRRRSLIGRLLMWLLVLGIVLPVGLTVVYAVVPPPVTYLMVQRLFEGRGLSRDWVAMRKMAPALPYAVIAAEDARFCEHRGFDFEAMRKAMKSNERGRKLRGGSTVSQQTAKNVFLWPARSYVRKGLEAYFTVLIETVWGKRRIMEVYLNTVEWGPGVYGAQAAARRNFGVDASQLTAQQAARLAAILPSPLKWKAARPGPYVSRRSRRIAAAAGVVRREGLGDCLRLSGARPKDEPPARRDERRKAAEAIMEQTAPPALPEDAVEPAEPEAALPPPEVAPAPDAPPVAEEAPLAAEPAPAAT